MDRVEDFFRVVGFLKKSRGLHLFKYWPDILLSAGGEKDYWHVRQPEMFEPLCGQNPHRLRHPNIHDDQIGTVVDGLLEALESIRSSQHFVTGSLQPNCQWRDAPFIIVHE